MATFLHPTRKVYYHRSFIPRKLRQLLKGRVELWRSLDTTDKDLAALRSAQWGARVQRVFVTLKKHGERMTQTEIESLVEHWLESALDEAEDHRAIAGPFSDQYREDQSDGHSIEFDLASEALISCDYRKVEKEADALLKAAGLPTLDHQGAEFGKLCRRLLQAKVEYAQVEQARWNGSESPRAKRVAAPVAAGPAAAPAKTGPLFSEVVEKFFKENPRAKRTDAQVQSEFEKFLEVLGGDRPITSISKTEGRAYKENLLHVRKLSLTTCVKHLSNLSLVFKWSEAQGYIPEGTNPIRGLAPSKKQAKKQAKPRRAFTDEQLLTVFGSQDFIKEKKERPERYWLTLLCLFEICRREEAGQLALADIGTEGGIPFLRITEDAEAGQSVKNEASKRRVPIHSSLIARLP